MARELFRQVLENRTSGRVSRLSALPLSVAVHAVVLAVLIVIPIFASDVLPLVQNAGIDWTPVVLPPTPPPIPPPASRPAVPTQENAGPTVPVEPPKGVGPERLIVPERPPDPDAPTSVGVVQGVGDPAAIGVVVSDAPPPAAVVKPVLASTLVTPPVRVRNVNPIYPEIPLRARLEGQVVIEAVIGVTGDIVEARVLQAPPLFAESALTAVRQWKYRPTLLNGRPVPVVLTVTVTFTLQR